MTVIHLPWPPRALSPNSRKDRRASTKTRADYKATGYFLTREVKPEPTTSLSITFHPPDKRKRDLDNMLASIKYALDGVAMGMGRDDSDWSTIFIRRGEKRRNGAVVIETMPEWDAVRDQITEIKAASET